jgi:hypothetical protein
MTQDNMQDVFPVNITFVPGEQPVDRKLTGFAKQTDTAFSKMTRAIGDPWDYNVHSGSSGNYTLSPAKLSQASIARLLGPSDYASPRGASFQEGVTDPCTISLFSYRNQWCVGFPLVCLSSPLDIADSGSGKVVPLVWGTDIVISVANDAFTTEKSSVDEIVEAGDFHIDYYAGIITTYSIPTSTVVLNVNNINMLGYGVPWGTSNVIPHWNQTTPLCYVTVISSVGGTTVYNIALPEVQKSVRDTLSNPLTGAVGDWGISAGSGWSIDTTGQSAQYRMPYQLTENLTIGDSIPEGAVYVYDSSTARIVPITTFTYYDEHNVRCEAPDDWLTAGATVRLIVTGSSIAEDVHYLMSALRDSRHNGLSAGAKNDTLQYSVPISHKNLTELYTDYISSSYSTPEEFYFTKSSFPTNPHPQYIHRSGYQASDLDGNHANSMRGNLVFAGIYPDYALGGGSVGGQMEETYGVVWGGHELTGTNTNTRLAWEGGTNIDTWVSGAALRFGFGLDIVGGAPGASDNLGALTLTSWRGTPLYLRGYSGSDEGDGAILGFDMACNSEMNYIKLYEAYRTASTDPTNCPVNIGQSISDILDITPGLSGFTFKRLSEEQIREFRFRAVSRNQLAWNAEQSVGHYESSLDTSMSFDVASKSGDGEDLILLLTSSAPPTTFRIGSSVTLSGFVANNITTTVDEIFTSGSYTVIHVTTSLVDENPAPAGAQVTVNTNEFNQYFVSPSMVGCDFVNLYSNAIFFSDTGDGVTTSFTTNGSAWLADGTITPSGLYFIPQGSSSEPYLAFAACDSDLEEGYSKPLEVGDRHGFIYTSSQGGDIKLSTDNNGNFGIWQGTGGISSGQSYLAAGRNSICTIDKLNILTYDTLDISAAGSTTNMSLTAGNILSAHGDSIYIRTMGSPYGVGSGDLGMFIESDFVGEARNGWQFYCRTYGGAGANTYLGLSTSDIELTVNDANPASTHSTLQILYNAVTLSSGGNIDIHNTNGGIHVSTLGYVTLDSVKTSTGNPGGPSNGMIVINTVDRNIKIYADTAWRTLVSW